jgi:hypothetical protein
MKRIITRHPMKRLAAVTALAGLALLAGCADPTAATGSVVSLLGEWSYVSAQDSPVHAAQEGTLSIAAQNGRSFTGTVRVVEVDQSGAPRSLTGSVQGRALDSTKVDFDVTIAGVTRRHLGVIDNGPVSGAWVGRAANGETYSGEFRAERRQ